MNTFKVADFAPSVLSDSAARTVFEALGTVFHADEMVLRQPAFIAAAAGGEDLFQQPVASGTLPVGAGKKQLANFAVESFPAAQRKHSGILARRRCIKGVVSPQYPVIKAEGLD